MEYLFESPGDIALNIAANFRRLRKRRKFTLEELSRRSGVSYSSIKRFEHTGEVSFVSLIKMAFVLRAEDEIRTLFSEVPPETIEEVIYGKY